MSAPDDNDGLPPNLPPIAERPTMPDIEPANDADAFGRVETPTEPPPIPAGRAMEALEAALTDFYRAAIMVESVAAAACRALDEMATTETP